ncbi:siderophore iron transporter [Exophiala viscosa]|uniref:siderophore iron transporter n=1 Tax=Exophiala viscosa TaxID=2486360 RepID=UPI00218E31EF|nr:siderophore iron transporter [Exophiala viscosa]
MHSDEQVEGPSSEAGTKAEAQLDGQYTPEDACDVQAPEGVQKIEAFKVVWSKWSLIIAYTGIYALLVWISLQQYSNYSLSAYVVSDFAAHSLVSTTSMVCFLIAGVVQVPIAKFLDLTGRMEGFILMVFFMELGLVMLTACENVATYTAAMVFYEIGFSGIGYVITVFIVDTTQPKNRGWMLGAQNLPALGTTFAGAPLAQAFLDHSTWRWAFGTFTIVIPFIAVPIILSLWANQRKSRKLGVVTRRPASGRTTWQSIIHYGIEFDAIGVALFGAGVTVFLLPFTLAASSYKSWGSGIEITMFVVGGVLIIAFVVYEWFWSPKSFIAFSLLKDRNVLGACIFNLATGMAYFVWESYYTSWLQVVAGLSITHAGYVGSIYWNCVGLAGIVSGLVVRQTGDFKWVAFAGTCLMTLGVGLLIHFRKLGVDVGYIVMCQLFIGFGGGIITIAQYLALLAPSVGKKQNTQRSVAVLLSLSSLFSKIGAAIGLCIAGGIWTNEFLDSLTRRLPDTYKSQAEQIYGSLVYQLLALENPLTKDAVLGAYDDMQRKLTITATALYALAFVGLALWQDVKLEEVEGDEEKKGVVI